jgi:hypothetical protein
MPDYEITNNAFNHQELTAEIPNFYTFKSNYRIIRMIKLLRLFTPQREPDRVARLIGEGQFTFWNLRQNDECAGKATRKQTDCFVRF